MVHEKSPSCTLASIPERPDAPELQLELAPPCHVLIWRAPPPRLPQGRAESGAIPIGGEGEPAAWKYPDAQHAIVVAIIGDPVPAPLREDSVARQRRASGYRCAGSVRGILLRNGQMSLTKKRENVGEFCVEVGMEEKGFWLLAHAP